VNALTAADFAAAISSPWHWPGPICRPVHFAKEIAMSSSALPHARRILVKGSKYLSAVIGIAARIAHAREQRRAIDALHRLSDYQLQDIGTGRSEIIRSVGKGRFDFGS
jgi:uncharacterized protein YjiS (DUF1127 family)